MTKGSIVASLVAFNGTKIGRACKDGYGLLNAWMKSKGDKNDKKYLPFVDEYISELEKVACKIKGNKVIVESGSLKDDFSDTKDFPFEESFVADNNLYVKDLETLKIAFKKHNPTPIERMMGYRLIENGYNFTYQEKVEISGEAQGRKYFLCDFIIDDQMIVIETEGKVHATEDNWLMDMTRQNFLTSMGFYIFRFGWNDVMEVTDKYDIMDFIKELVDLNDIPNRK